MGLHGAGAIKMHSSSFFGIMLLCEMFSCQFGACFWGILSWMVSEGLLSIHHRLQIHYIVNVNICMKGPDGKAIVFCRPL